jgi:hypothetical protein
MRGKRVAQRVATRPLLNSGVLDRASNGLLQPVLRGMMPPSLSRSWVNREFHSREGVLPQPIGGCVRVLTFQGIG